MKHTKEKRAGEVDEVRKERQEKDARKTASTRN